MAWTISLGLKNILMKFYNFGHFPIFTTFQSLYEENNSDSMLFRREINTTNDYITKSSMRFDFNILEATKETLCTINVQVAVWVFFNECLLK